MRVPGLVGVLASAVVVAPCAHADSAEEVALNGTFTAFSDGQWAQTNQSYHDEASVTQAWTITSTCPTYQDCTGKIVSDQGWTADLVFLSGRWKATHTVAGWEHCDDGTTGPGEQTFTFWQEYPDPSKLSGWDQTIGHSGACGVNRWLNITMPLKVTPVG